MFFSLFYCVRFFGGVKKTWWTFRMFLIFFCLLGEGEGGVRGARRGGVGFSLKISQ